MEQKTLSIVAKARDDASSELKKVQSAVDQTAEKVNKSASGFDKFSAGLTKAGDKMVGTGKKMSLGITLPIVALGVATVNALQHVEVLGAQTDAVIKSTGGAAKVTRDHVEGLADSLEKMTGVEAEAVQSGANMLLTFTNIRNGAGKNNKIFDDSSKILLDMATAMNNGVAPAEEQMKAQAIQLGKALNDPIKGVTALSKVGVSFTQDQKDQIKTLVESGKTMEAQKIILAELNKEFGGSAESFGNTTAGKVAKLKNQFGEITENIMAGAMPAINNFATSIQKLMTKFQKLTPAQQGLIVKVVAVAAAIGPVLIIIGKMAQGISALIKVVQLLGNSFVGTAIKAVASAAKTAAIWVATGVKMVASAAMTAAAHIASAVAVAAAWVVANAAMLLGIGLIIAAVVGLVIIIVKNWDTIKNAAVAAWNWIKDAALAVFNAIKAAVMFYINSYIMAFQLLLAGVKLVWEGIKIAATFVFNAIKAVVMFYINAYVNIFKLILRGAQAVWNGIGVAARFLFNSVIMPVVNAIRNAFSNVGNAIRNVFTWVVNTAKNSFNNVINTIKTVFGKVGGFITAPFKGAFNAVADLWNKTLGSIKWKAPSWVPGIGGKEIGFPQMPKLATGGIVTGPTVAMIGEGREPEAVIPLSKLESMMRGSDSPASAPAQAPEIHVHVTVPGGIFTNDSSLSRLAVQIGQELQKQMKVQGTDNVNMLRST